MPRFHLPFFRRSVPKIQSPVEKGTLFELLTLHTLAKLGMKLERQGGANDGGIDLKGEWKIPKSKIPPLKVFATGCF
jgi:hypothetical protein